MSTGHVATSCAKCILLGEHAILEGGSALALPIKNLRVEIEYLPSAEQEIFMDIPLDPQAKLLFWDLLKEDFGDVETRGTYHVRSRIPIGAGLGSSAALCVALHKLFRKNISQYELIERAWKSEFKFHGKSSGIDPATIAVEKALHFKNPSDFSALEISAQLRGTHIFVLFDTQVRRSTQNAIALTNSLKSRDHKQWKECIAKLHRLVASGKEALETGDALLLGQAMNETHLQLSELGVSHEKLETLRNFALDQGAVGAKLTGAGRGGFLLVLFDLQTWDAVKIRNHADLGSFFELRL